jgi:hypothetical protein
LWQLRAGRCGSGSRLSRRSERAQQRRYDAGIATPVAERLLAAEEYLFTQDDPGTLSELVCGTVVRKPSPGTMDGRIAVRITARLAAFVGGRSGGGNR